MTKRCSRGGRAWPGWRTVWPSPMVCSVMSRIPPSWMDCVGCCPRGITDGELFDAGLSSGIVLAAATCDDAYGFVHDVASAVAEGRRSAVAAMSRTRL